MGSLDLGRARIGLEPLQLSFQFLELLGLGGVRARVSLGADPGELVGKGHAAFALLEEFLRFDGLFGPLLHRGASPPRAYDSF